MMSNIRRIAINLITFSSIQGIEIFSKNIISEIIKNKKTEEILLLQSKDTPDLLNFSGVKTIKIENLDSKYSKVFYQQTFIYFLLRKHKIDFLFCPAAPSPFFYKNKVVVIHDCAYDRFKEFENIISKTYFQMMFYGAKYFSKKIITVSNFSKEEIVNLYNVKPSKIEVIYEGVPKMPKVKNSTIENTLNKFKIDKPYFLYIGNRRPRKNLGGLLDGFKLFKEEFSMDYYLVIAGKKDDRFMDLEKEIKNRDLENSVILTGFISEKEKVSLYKKCKAFTFPSYYEGFGLPVLEAQSLGVPVLTSNTSSLPEVGGKAALYVDPYNKETIAYGMKEISLNKELREKLVKEGFKNIKRFSWEKSAKQLFKVFNNL